MAKAETAGGSSRVDTARDVQVTAARIDPPHVPASAEPQMVVAPELRKTPQEGLPLAPDLISRQLAAQAAQLAEHLQARQRELDEREAALNAWAARLDHDGRTERLWLRERERELDEREQNLAATEDEFRQRLDRLACAEEALQKKARACDEALAEREAVLDEHAERLAERWATLEQHESTLSRLDQHARHDEAAQREEAVRQACGAIEEAEQRLALEREDFARRVEQRQAQLRDDEEQRRQQWRKLAREQRRLTARLEHQRQAVVRRSEEVDRAAAGLETQRRELEELQQWVAVERAALEQLHAESLRAPEAGKQLGRIRAELIERSLAPVRRQREELETLHRELVARHEALVHQQAHFEAWSVRRQRELEGHADRGGDA